MTTTAPATGELRLALDEIRVRANVREFDVEHVDKLAQSITLRGVLVPLIVRVIDDGYEPNSSLAITASGVPPARPLRRPRRRA